MLKFIKNFWKEIFALTKTWSIRKQMLVCYMIAMFLILILILFVVMLNIYILRYQTVQEIDSTLGTQATHNMQQLVRENSIFMHSKLTQVTVMFALIQQMLLGMSDESTFSFDYLLSYTPGQLPEKCWAYDSFHQRVCTAYSSYSNYTSDFDSAFLRKISRFDNIWPSILQQTGDIAIRYFLYFPGMGILKNYPGMSLPQGYLPNETEWYRCFVTNNSTTSATVSYKDSLGSGQVIISLMYPLLDSSNATIGLAVADLPLNPNDYLFDGIYSVTYLKTGFTSVAYKDGTILDINNTFWGESTNIKQVNKHLWQNMTLYRNDTSFFIFNDNIYRVASYPLNLDFYKAVDSSLDNWYFMIMLIVDESTVMEYRDDSKTKIDNAGALLIIITLICSAITIGVVSVLIHFLAKSITAPLKGIIEFTNKINAQATDKDAVSGEVTLKLDAGKRIEHVGVKIEFVGQIEIFYGSLHEFTNLVALYIGKSNQCINLRICMCI